MAAARSRTTGCARCASPRRIVSAIDPVVLLHLRDDLRIGQLVRGLDSDNTLRQRLGACETLLELQLGLTRPERSEEPRVAPAD
jgi:hypothetical protein